MIPFIFIRCENLFTGFAEELPPKIPATARFVAAGDAGIFIIQQTELTGQATLVRGVMLYALFIFQVMILSISNGKPADNLR